MKLTYDDVVSICDAHGICLPVDCVEMVVEIAKHATAHSGHSSDGSEKAESDLDSSAFSKWGVQFRKDNGGLVPIPYDAWLEAAKRSAIAAQSAPVPQDGDERAGFETWFSDPARTAYVGDKASAYKGWQAALASNKALQQPVPAGERTPVNFMGINPLNIADGACLPMIPDSWRFGFRRTEAGFDFSFQDDGPLVAWESVKDALASNKAAAVAVGEPIPGSPAYALRGLYKVADYYVNGAPASPEEYIAWQSGIIEAITKAKVPDPKYYGGSAGEGDQHEVKCAYVDGWNDCRTSILATPQPSQAAAALDDEPWWVFSLRKLWGDGTCDLDTRRAAKVACDIFDCAESPAPIASAAEAAVEVRVHLTKGGLEVSEPVVEFSKAFESRMDAEPGKVFKLYTHPAAAQPSRAEVLEELPPLPQPSFVVAAGTEYWNKDQMAAYAAEARGIEHE